MTLFWHYFIKFAFIDAQILINEIYAVIIFYMFFQEIKNYYAYFQNNIMLK